MDPAAGAPEIARGVVFETGFEMGCIALAAPDALGQFAGLDSDRVECQFIVAMVVACSAQKLDEAEVAALEAEARS
jgi:hypothetical protein